LKEVNHAERAHALLSASGSERWINCPASARLEEPYPEETSSYAEEGTLAHEFAELMLRVDLRLMTMDNYRKAIEELKKSPHYYSSIQEDVKPYVDYVKEQYKAAKQIDKHARILIEEKLDLTDWIELGFGTSDVIIVCNLGIEVIDLKFGKGKQVFAEENTQLMSYGRGAMKVAERTTTFNKVTLTIVQPRLEHISTWSLSTKELRDWAENVLKPKAVEAFRGDGVQCAGDWCQFCKARPRCRALHDLAMEQARRDFDEVLDPRLINDNELFLLYRKADFITKFLSDVQALVLKEAVNGKQWPGHKLVEGKSNRQWVSDLKVIEVLESQLYEREEFTNPKLKSLGDLEKLLGKAAFNEHLNPLTIKPPGAPTLVSEDDKRPLYGVAQAAKDFAEPYTEFEIDDLLN